MVIEKQVMDTEKDKFNRLQQEQRDLDASYRQSLKNKKEREAMDDVRRALRQKKHLIERWKDRADRDSWQSRFSDIESAVDELQWSHAATLLQRLTSDLDSEGKASEEALELLEYVQGEWKILRNQCEASSIGVGDEQRVAAEREVALALEAHQESSIDKTLQHLATADGLMEKLKRRV